MEVNSLRSWKLKWTIVVPQTASKAIVQPACRLNFLCEAHNSPYNFIQVSQVMDSSEANPRRGMTMVASHFNGWEGTTGWRMRAVGTQHPSASGRVPKGTLFTADNIPAIEMAGYHCQMPTALDSLNLRNLNSFIYQELEN